MSLILTRSELQSLYKNSATGARAERARTPLPRVTVMHHITGRRKTMGNFVCGAPSVQSTLRARNAIVIDK